MGKRSGIMLCYPLEERRLLESKFGWTWPVVVQPKLDGERCRAINKKGKITLLSSECNEIISVPHINKQLEEMSKRFYAPELDGELYVHRWDLSDIHSVVSRQSDETRHEKSELMEYHIFDLVTNTQQALRTWQLSQYTHSGDQIKVVPYIMAADIAEVMMAYDFYLDLGYEGIIVRHPFAPYIRKRSRFVLKFKPKKNDYYKITDAIEAISKGNIPLKMIGAFRCQGTDGTNFKIGAGKLTHQARKDLWKDRQTLVGKFAHVQYQNVTSGGAPGFGLCLDIIDKNPEEISGEGIL